MALRQRVFLWMIVVVALSPAVARPAPADSPAGKGSKPDSLDVYFDTGPLPRLHIQLDPAEMRRLDADPKTYIRAQIRETAPGQPEHTYRDVGLHLKGGFGSLRPVSDKPALTLNFDKFVPGQKFHGLDKLHLNNSVQDASYMCENLGGWVFRESGCPAPRVSAARVWLNGRDLGIFVLKEGFDSPFYKRCFNGSADGDLYDGNFTDVDRTMEVHLGGPRLPAIDAADRAAARARAAQLAERQAKAAARLRDLANACRQADPDRRNQMIERLLDVDRFIDFLACETMVAHWDGYGPYRNNFRIYYDPKSDRLVFLPHGMDQLFQRPDHSLYGNNALVALALTHENPAGRKRYLDRVADIRKNGAFQTEKVVAQLDRIAARIQPLFAEIGDQAAAEHAARTEVLRKRIIQRCESIDRQLANPRKPAVFDAGGIATLSNWKPFRQDDGGNAVSDEINDNGRTLLRVTCNQPGGTASFRTSELLTPGTYTFSARMKTVAVVPARVVAAALGGTGACLRISGNRRAVRYTGNNNWQLVTCTFTVSEPIKEVTFVCELSAGTGHALFDPASTRLQRNQGAVEP